MLRLIFLSFAVLLTIELVDSKVFYFDGPKNNYYPVTPEVEQASKDLDMTFSAGDPDDADDGELHPVRKVFSYPSVDRGIYYINHDVERPIYYRLPEIPVRKIIYGDQNLYPEKNRKLLRLNNPHKGEIVLELRVIANNNEV